MRVVVTGSAGHLGEALVLTLRSWGYEAVGIDVVASPTTDVQASVLDREEVRRACEGAAAVLHAATLHKPHVATHTRQQFVDVNVSGTLALLETAAASGVRAFVYTSTTSAFGRALVPAAGEPAAWITEGVQSVPKNVYGTTKVAAEALCELFARNHGLPCVVLRTSRFFPEADDDPERRAAYSGENLKTSELLYRRVDLEDVVAAHLLAIETAPSIGFDRYVISATTPFTPEDLAELRVDAPRVVARRVPAYAAEYARRGWSMLPSIERVYVNAKARRELGWQPRHDFASEIERLANGELPGSALARRVGAKSYWRSADGDALAECA
jgi:nucleoside-diphosphate-sugar epimerase